MVKKDKLILEDMVANYGMLDLVWELYKICAESAHDNVDNQLFDLAKKESINAQLLLNLHSSLK